MQLTIYVPKQKEPIVRALAEAARRTGRPKNGIILDALDVYLRQHSARLGSFHLGQVSIPSRDDVYVDREDE
jgi:hypothetical protein